MPRMVRTLRSHTHAASQPRNEVEIELRIARHIAKQSFDNQVTTVLIRIPIL